jgi:hypothetical protein
MNKERFATEYRKALLEAVLNHPEEYGWPVAQVPQVADKMLAAVEAGTFNHNSRAFRATAKALGIKPTRKALLTFWNSKP